jgi:quercetin dioxygenase-like cupin family protein
MKTVKPLATFLAVAAGALIAPAAYADTPVKSAGFVAVKAAELKWMDVPSVGPGAKIAVIEGNLKAAEPFTFRLKLPPESKIGVHTHPTVERVTVVDGALHFAPEDKFDPARATVYKTGDGFIVPPGMAMFAFTKKQGATLQIHGMGPWGITYLDPADDPSIKK